jgi:alpha,alpha-trehalase
MYKNKNIAFFVYALVIINAIYLLWRSLPIAKTSFKSIYFFITPDTDNPLEQNLEIYSKYALRHAEKLYLNPKYLRAVKEAFPTCDSKSIVDRATKRPLKNVLADLAVLNENNLDEVRKFVSYNFELPGAEITCANLTDWTEEPTFIRRIKNPDLKRFSIELNKIWLELYKKFDMEKLGEDCVSSHLPMKHPFIVPGGRFIEMYYWDTYWTIQGMLVCEMFDTVKMMLENFIQFIEQYGFIPNGSRMYYLNRSQPPYFAQMIKMFYDFSTRSKSLSKAKKVEHERFVLDVALPAMTKEYEFWMSSKVVEVNMNGSLVKLNVYRADTTAPRPESYFEDTTAAKLFTSSRDKSKFYQDIATAAGLYFQVLLIRC